MNKQRYLFTLMTMPSNWLRESMKTPTSYMRPMHIALHALALRKMGCVDFQKELHK